MLRHQPRSFLPQTSTSSGAYRSYQQRGGQTTDRLNPAITCCLSMVKLSMGTNRKTAATTSLYPTDVVITNPDHRVARKDPLATTVANNAFSDTTIALPMVQRLRLTITPGVAETIITVIEVASRVTRQRMGFSRATSRPMLWRTVSLHRHSFLDEYDVHNPDPRCRILRRFYA
jgi:hypothetical protein